MKTHLVSYDAPAQFPQYVRALCGIEVERAKPVLEFDLRNGELWAGKTLLLCQKCLLAALMPVEDRTWVYGILPAEFADRMNAGIED